MENNTLKLFESTIREKLRSLGYFSIEIQNEHEKSFNVIADGNLRNIFLKVIIRLVSEHINILTSEEIKTIKLSADSINKEPWAAILSVNEQGQLVDGIEWKNLSRPAV